MRMTHVAECLDLADTLNFTRTAERFHITQPALSKHIAALERELGSALFLRERGTVSLTTFGEAVLPFLAAIEQDRLRLMDTVESFRSEANAKLSVGYQIGIAADVLPVAHAEFEKKHPGTRLDYHVVDYYEISNALEEGLIDVAIGSHVGQTKRQRLAGELNYLHLFDDGFYVMAGSNHRLAQSGKSRLGVRDIAGEVIMAPYGGENDEALSILEGLLGKGAVDRVIGRNVGLGEIPLILETENCIAILPMHMRDYYKRHNMSGAFFELDCAVPSVPMGVIWRNDDGAPLAEDYARIFKAAFQA